MATEPVHSAKTPKWDEKAVDLIPIPHFVASDGWLYLQMLPSDVADFENRFPHFLNAFKKTANGAFALFRGWNALQQAFYSRSRQVIAGDVPLIELGDLVKPWERVTDVLSNGGAQVYVDKQA